MWEPRPLTPLWAFTACYRDSFTFGSNNKSSELLLLLLLFKSWDSAVGIVTGYWLDDRVVGVRVPVRSRIYTFPCRPDGHWGPSNLLSNGHRGLFPRRQSGRRVKLTTHLHLAPRSRKCGSTHPLTICFHGVVLNYLSTGNILTFTFAC
jgi:hypothetical protein